MELCLPAKLYAVSYVLFAIWSYVYFKHFVIVDILIDILVLGLLTWLLNFFCKNDYKKVSWFLFTFFFITSVLGVFLIKKNKLTEKDLSM